MENIKYEAVAILSDNTEVIIYSNYNNIYEALAGVSNFATLYDIESITIKKIYAVDIIK